jgi:hypothetical protein
MSFQDASGRPREATSRNQVLLLDAIKRLSVETSTPDLDQYCWLKGDLSLETLRQAVIDRQTGLGWSAKQMTGLRPDRDG